MLASAVGAQEAAPPPGPSLEFLEYLGEWEGPDGRWLDPTSLAQETAPALPAPAADGTQGTGKRP